MTADLVHEVRARLDQAGFEHVRIIVSGGLNPERIRYFKEAGAPVDSFAVGSYISGATPIDFTGDIKEIDGDADRQARPHPRADRLAAPPAGRPGGLPRGVGDRLTARQRRARPCHHRGMEDPRAATSADDERETAYDLLQRGQALLERRHHAQAAIVLERADRLEPRARARSSRRSAGRTTTPASPSARAATFEALLEVDPSAHYAHYALGQSLKRLGRRTRRGRTCGWRSRSARTPPLPRRPRRLASGALDRRDRSLPRRRREPSTSGDPPRSAGSAMSRRQATHAAVRRSRRSAIAQPGQPEQRRRVDFASRISPRSAAATASRHGHPLEQQALVLVGPEPLAVGRPQVRGEVQVHQLGGEPGRRVEPRERAATTPARMPVSSSSSRARRASGSSIVPSSADVERAGRDLEQRLADRDPVLADEQDAVLVVDARGSRPRPDGRRCRGSRACRRPARSCRRGTSGSGPGGGPATRRRARRDRPRRDPPGPWLSRAGGRRSGGDRRRPGRASGRSRRRTGGACRAAGRG